MFLLLMLPFDKFQEGSEAMVRGSSESQQIIEGIDEVPSCYNKWFFNFLS